MKKIIPNLLTTLRILIIPIIVLSLYLANKEHYYYMITTIAFVMASITDFADGKLARTWQVQSNLGEFLDPIADKLIIITTIVMLIHVKKIDNLNIFPSLIIIFREILISNTREFMKNIKLELAVIKSAKIKTTLQMCAITLLTVSGCNIFAPQLIQKLGELTLWISAIFTLYSGYSYFETSIKHFSNPNN
ncbi:MAG: CDP-diacylglycerol--glycerol-3-phosphate 3-phosphatidyltransferase [Rickettsiaceae bacterium H1]|nr:CDP-diacylglycerol--glycerol-3-phosphate 3-phosphatidyltransferase [Rickettsiaceae bacterium H1]